MYHYVKANICFILLQAANTKISAGVCKEMLVRHTCSFLLLKQNITETDLKPFDKLCCVIDFI